MYDELERAAGVRPSKGISILGWLGIALLTFTMIGVAGAFWAVRYVENQVHDVIEAFEVYEASEVSPLVARTVARTLGALEGTPAMDSDDLTRAVSRALAVSTRLEDMGSAHFENQASASAQADGEEVEGFLRIRTSEGEFTADLRADEGAGALVVRGPDGEVIVDLSADAEGGRLYVKGEGEIARIEAGSNAAGPPSWVPSVRGDRFDIEPVVSGHAGEAMFGAVTWSSDESPERWIERYTERLIDAGYEIHAEHRLDGSDEGSASVLARDEATGRMVLLAAGEEGNGTQVVLGWGHDGEG